MGGLFVLLAAGALTLVGLQTTCESAYGLSVPNGSCTPWPLVLGPLLGIVGIVIVFQGLVSARPTRALQAWR